MTTGQRLLIVVLVIAAVIAAGWTALAATVWATGGLITVSVDEGPDGVRLFVPVPFAVVDAAVAAVPAIAGHHHAQAGFGHGWGRGWGHGWGHGDLDAGFDLGEYEPMVRGMLDVLAGLPDDVTLVEVVDGGEHVLVRMEDGDLRIHVDDGDVRVRVSMPARSVARTVSRLLS